MRGAPWTARDWRQFVAIALLAAGNVPLTIVMGWAMGVVQWDPANARAERLGIAAAILIGINFFGLSAILGRRKFKIGVGDKTIELDGAEAERVLNEGDAA